jgi:lipopolysaccharide biosynthesis protein
MAAPARVKSEVAVAVSVDDNYRTELGPAPTDSERLARVVAFYLPQFHPIPENDEWWGTGFTEWTNVAKATPLYRGHLQPNLPGELGFYDLRVPEIREAQAALASAYGVAAFCYWHYWFAGRRLLERPFAEVLSSGRPDFPFCLAWANQTWSGIWHGAPHRVLIEQTYPGSDDYAAHFAAVLPALRDPRYFTVDGRPLFVVYRPWELPASRHFTDLWRDLADRAGLPGIHLVGLADDVSWDPREHGFDSAILQSFSHTAHGIRRSPAQKVTRRLPRFGLDPRRSYRVSTGRPMVYDYEEIDLGRAFEGLREHHFPAVVPNWDNTPRSGRRGVVLHRSHPGLFSKHLRTAVRHVEARAPDERVVFLKSWNEWAEGNYLEPDRRFGRGWLEAVRAEVFAGAAYASPTA